MPGRNINRTEHFDKFVAAEVKSGRFGNASEMVREGLRLMGTRKREEQAQLKWLWGAVNEGLHEIVRGEGRTYACPEELDQRMDELAKAASAAVGKRRGADPRRRQQMRLAPRAEHGIVEALLWSEECFGSRAAARYRSVLS
jgi:antitoxin ParD1/3/4